MLLEKVDTSGLIVKLIKKAKKQNPQFDFNQTVEIKAFSLSEQYNQGKINDQTFEEKALELFGITNFSEEFWQAFMDMITIGNIEEKLQLLKDVAQKNNALIYLASDTNSMHFLKICSTVPIRAPTSPNGPDNLDEFHCMRHFMLAKIVKNLSNTLSQRLKLNNLINLKRLRLFSAIQKTSEILIIKQ